MHTQEPTPEPATWRFADLARHASHVLGTPIAFAAAGGVVLVWVLTGPLFGYSDTWQLIINTGTTIVTFLMVFLLQNTQNRNARALHLKLDELLRSLSVARNRLINLENCTDEELDQVERQFNALRRREERAKVNGGSWSEQMFESWAIEADEPRLPMCSPAQWGPYPYSIWHALVEGLAEGNAQLADAETMRQLQETITGEPVTD